MDMSKFFIGVNKANKLFIGYGELKKDGTVKYKDKSDDRSIEILNAVAQMMKNRMNNRKTKPYFGYEIPRCGKLVLIKQGYEFEVYKKNEAINIT